MFNPISLRGAAEILSVDVLFLTHIIDVGDILPTQPVPKDFREIVFTIDDIERFRPEIARRRFLDFKAEYTDVFRSDEGPGARGLEFGPGWTGILREFCDSLREFQTAGYRARLRWGKEKFGALRLFTDHVDELVAYVAERRGIAHGKSLRTCQECGEPAQLRFGHSICLTLCDRHRHLVGEPDPARDGIILDVNAWSREQREQEE
ncbi:hypothetical protein G6K88_13865 [Agrobacterium rhizogenes]|uniref:hypothetical protein n=1 Tax=Rhizobium rhizogenes TaxID=359 RepID=UPI00115C46EA|nr:hypothetical protein [Rhizobium rhizogenes]NTI03106.1 hypothetical protein [Rhizobium rhizogenes]NTI09910.1 hypothetical protein [Rhizobium rhizogenes]TRB20255.1 hypothetical protein EXN70_26350 [Rhizobium rhizogenes]